jgi:hypothetical protein
MRTLIWVAFHSLWALAPEAEPGAHAVQKSDPTEADSVGDAASPTATETAKPKHVRNDGTSTAPLLQSFVGEIQADAIDHFRVEELRLSRLGQSVEAKRAYQEYVNAVEKAEGREKAAQVLWARASRAKARTAQEIDGKIDLLTGIANDYKDSKWSGQAEAEAVQLMKLAAFDLDSAENLAEAMLEKARASSAPNYFVRQCLRLVVKWPSARLDVNQKKLEWLERCKVEATDAELLGQISRTIDSVGSRG